MISKPKFKICRRLGPGVYDKCQTPKFSANSGKLKKGARPKALSEYGKALVEKQKVRFSYGITERQLSNYVGDAMKAKGAGAADKLFERLETRLDNIVYRMGLAHTRRLARQMVSHGHFVVNGTRTTVPSFEIKAGDVITIREGSRGSALFSNLAEKLKEYNAPVWLGFNVEKGEGSIKDKPKNIETFLDLNAVLEFYSR
ncbi:MAG: 30S ribosomal protein S4 [Candidatus Nomurabacteria bacterium]|nr:30S ribosomal protein S4 [Candidatus Nomurabacteria bacterium]